MNLKTRLSLLLMAGLASSASHAGVLTFGDMNCLGMNCYGTSDPTAGAITQGLAPGVVTTASTGYFHSYPFTPGPGEFPGTDTIYVGSVQTGFQDGYSNSAARVNGPAVFTMDYSSLIAPGQSLATLTLGIAADDFQFPGLGDPYIATLNGAPAPALTTQLESLNETGPTVQFFTIGLDPTIDTGNHILTLSIDEGGLGGDGYAVDFLTIGATTTPSGGIPEPSTVSMLTLGGAGLVLAALRKTRRT